MKIWIYSLVLAAMIMAPMASAACYVNGEEVPCDDFFAGFGALMVVFAIIGIIAFVFWLWMLIDCLKRDFDNKVVWVLLMIFIGVLGSILYYFLVKRKNVQGTAPPQQAQPPQQAEAPPQQ